MTAISAPAARTGATPLESLLLRASSALDDHIAARLDRRASAVYRCAAAQARGAIGVLPR